MFCTPNALQCEAFPTKKKKGVSELKGFYGHFVGRSCTPCRVEVFCTSLLAADIPTTPRISRISNNTASPHTPLLSLASFPVRLIARRERLGRDPPNERYGRTRGRDFELHGFTGAGRGRGTCQRDIRVRHTFRSLHCRIIRQIDSF